MIRGYLDSGSVEYDEATKSWWAAYTDQDGGELCHCEYDTKEDIKETIEISWGGNKHES